METPDFNKAAIWIQNNKPASIDHDISIESIEITLSALYSKIRTSKVAIIVPDLFNISLEFLYIPSDAEKDSSITLPRSDDNIEVEALETIGSSLANVLDKEGNDLVCYELDDGAKAFAYSPTARETLLKATGITILGS